MWFCSSLLNVVVIRRSMAGLWRHIDFSRWRPWSQKSTCEFRFSDGTCLKRWMQIDICIPNFDEISQCTAKLKVLPVSENGRSPYWNFTSRFDFYLGVAIGVSFCIHLSNFVAIWRLAAEFWRNIDFFQDGGQKIGNLLSSPGFVRTLF